MSDDEQDLNLAGAYGLAAITLQSMILVRLVEKGILTTEDARQVTRDAANQLGGVEPSPDLPEMVILARSALEGIAKLWERKTKPN